MRVRWEKVWLAPSTSTGWMSSSVRLSSSCLSAATVTLCGWMETPVTS